MSSPSDHHHLSPVLSAVRFPVHRWELVVAAETYGADLRTRTVLRRLTRTTYVSREMLLRELAAITGAAGHTERHHRSAG